MDARDPRRARRPPSACHLLADREPGGRRGASCAATGRRRGPSDREPHVGPRPAGRHRPDDVRRRRRSDAGGRSRPRPVPSPTCLRPPQGVIDEPTRELAARRGLSVETWTIDPQDWNEPGVDAIVDSVVGQVNAGDVVLLHDGGGDHAQTAGALDELLDRLGRAGFRFTVLPGC